MTNYEQSKAIDAPPDEVFTWLTDVNNLSGYLLPSRCLDRRPLCGRCPRSEGEDDLELPNGSSFDAGSYLATDELERRM